MPKVKPPKIEENVLTNLNKFYEEKSDIYDKLTKYEDYNNDILKTILKMTDFKNKTVVELGCGTGKFTIPLSSKVKKIYALDKTKSMLKILRKKIKSKKIKNIKIIESGFDEISLPKESIDIILSVWSFPAHSKNWERDLKKLKTILKKGGIMILVDNHYSGEYKKMRNKILKKEFTNGLNNFLLRYHEWFKSMGFKNRSLNILVNFVTKKNIEKVCAPFFGYEISTYLLARDRVSFKKKVSIFYWTKN
jgi:ubiquinone/menaquinone biosynthesis C-methylase UbiE